MKDHSQYLIRLLQEEVAQAQAEVRNLQNSLRYRAGSLLMEAFPPSRRSFYALRELLCLFFAQMGGGRSKKVIAAPAMVSDEALAADILVLAFSPDTLGQVQSGTWVTTDAAQLAAVMDAMRSPVTVLLHQLDQAVLRRLARWQALGGLVHWEPLPDETYSPVLLGYLESLLANPIEPCA